VDDEFAAERVALKVLEHLERRREDVVSDEAAVKREVEEALVPIRRAYEEAMLPPSYLEALLGEIRKTVPAAWQRVAAVYTDRERREFGLWRGGDPVARLAYVAAGLVLGGLIVAAPFIPIWEKWLPLALAVAAWWLPDVQVRWHKRKYARALGRIALNVARAQPLLDETISVRALLQEKGEDRGG
jgi:hypothetical protein